MYQGRRRKPNRRSGYDYSSNGWYFVTVCAQNRECLFGEIKDGQMVLNMAGLLVKRIWQELPRFYQGIGIDEFVVMPNHLHGIVIITNVGTGPCACPQTPTMTGQPQGVVPTRLSLSDVLRNFKSLTTTEYLRQIKHNHWPPFYRQLWQRSFHDHVIRDEKSHLSIREYIRVNPGNWFEDAENPKFTAIS